MEFDCLLDKGLKLPRPKIAPFRLTPDMFDAFGVMGYEGVFRCACEVFMQKIVRSNRESLKSVEEPFVHDIPS